MLRSLVLAGFLTGGCAMTGANLTHGPALITVYKDSGGVGISSKQQKRGEACSYNVMSLIAIGDGGIQAAKARGGIKVVSHFDKSVFNVFFFGKACTIVYGQ